MVDHIVLEFIFKWLFIMVLVRKPEVASDDN